MGNDPPGQFTRALHPRVGRHGTPAGGDPDRPLRDRPRERLPAEHHPQPALDLPDPAALDRERFDLLHLHEPMTPTPCIASLALFDGPMVGTHHASGDLGWMRFAPPVWGFLEERLDRRIAVSGAGARVGAAVAARRVRDRPERRADSRGVEPSGREHRVVFAGRHEPRKGLQVLLRAWPDVRRRTGATLRIAGADPLAVRLLLSRLRVPDEGIEVLGFLSQDDLTAELASAKALVAPSLGGESFGMVLTRAFACATRSSHPTFPATVT